MNPMTSIVRIDYDNARYDIVMAEAIMLGKYMQVKDVIVRRSSQGHFHVTIHLRKPIMREIAVDLLDRHTHCDKQYLEFVKASREFNIRDTDYRDITPEMEEDLFVYFRENGCPREWLAWYATHDHIKRRGDAKARQMTPEEVERLIQTERMIKEREMPPPEDDGVEDEKPLVVIPKDKDIEFVDLEVIPASSEKTEDKDKYIDIDED